MFITLFLPDVPGLCLEAVEADEQGIRLTTSVTQSVAPCPVCAEPATRIHSRYQRTVTDLPWADRIVRVLVQVRRFFCDNPTCHRAIFAERLGSAITTYARRTTRLTGHLQRLAFALSGEAGAPLVTAFGMPASASTLRRLQRRAALPTPPSPKIIGVDDFAFRKGQRYGTLIVDLEQHRPVDVLPDREAETLAAWLRDHPQIEVISRDRASAYADGATQGAPQALQVADRFHLIQNAGDALQRVLQHHPAALRTAAYVQADVPPPAPPPPAQPEPAAADHAPPLSPPSMEMGEREQRFQTVLTLHAQGWSVRRIAAEVQLNWRTVKRYILARELPKRGGPTIQMTSSVTPYLGYVAQRWREGCHNGMQLLEEIRAKGYQGSYSSMCRALKRYRQGDGRRTVPTLTIPRPPRALSPRQAMWLLVRPAEELTEAERAARQMLCTANEAIATAAMLAQTFGQIVRERAVAALDPWLEAAATSGVAEFKRLAASLRRDYGAVQAALTLVWSNGQLEGQINRLKGIKKAMYGRGKFDLLRRRVLYATERPLHRK
ncbi:MAG TPA: ISL3 family transposase [Chloroflexota bacterium]|nr:ISL3 family transposase [Chloroflexota bacterium]